MLLQLLPVKYTVLFIAFSLIAVIGSTIIAGTCSGGSQVSQIVCMSPDCSVSSADRALDITANPTYVRRLCCGETGGYAAYSGQLREVQRIYALFIRFCLRVRRVGRVS